MFRKTAGIFLLMVTLGLSAFLLNCGSSSSSRPAGVLFMTSQGSDLIDSFSINLKSGDLSQLPTGTPTGVAPTIIFLDPSATVAYVLNTGDSSVTTYTVNSNGTLTSGSTASVGNPGAIGMARDSAGNFLFVVSRGNQVTPQLAVFSIKPGSPNLTAVGTPLTLTRVPTAIAAVTVPDPLNSQTKDTLLYVTSNQDLQAHNDNTMSEYTVDSNGNVSEAIAGGSPITTGSDPQGVVGVYNNQANTLFVYVSNDTPDNSLSIFSVCITLSTSCPVPQNFTMSAVGPPVSVGINPLQIITDATRNFLYVVNNGSSTISSFRIAPSKGTLTALNPATVSTGPLPVALSLHPNGEFLFVANSGTGAGTGSVSSFPVNLTSGSLGTQFQVSGNSASLPAGVAAK